MDRKTKSHIPAVKATCASNDNPYVLDYSDEIDSLKYAITNGEASYREYKRLMVIFKNLGNIKEEMDTIKSCMMYLLSLENKNYVELYNEYIGLIDSFPVPEAKKYFTGENTKNYLDFLECSIRYHNVKIKLIKNGYKY